MQGKKRPFVDIAGRRFGRLTAAWPCGRNRGRSGVVWLCICDCGGMRYAADAELERGTTTSCGCAKTKHGHARNGAPSRTYSSWEAMKARCGNPNHGRYADWGGRGIAVCERWQKFENFLADMGEKPKGLSIERLDNNGNYEPGNCKWASAREQQLNRRVQRYEVNGESLSISDAAARLGMQWKSVHSRLQVGWPVERAFTTPRFSR